MLFRESLHDLIAEHATRFEATKEFSSRRMDLLAQHRQPAETHAECLI